MRGVMRRRVAVAAMAAVAALGLAACGGDDAAAADAVAADDGDATGEDATTGDGADDADAKPANDAATDDEPWSVTAGMLDGSVGDTFEQDCPADGDTDWEVWGGDHGQYTDDSAICVAAVHAGLITAEEGGTVTVEITPGRETYGDGWQANGVTSSPWTSAWSGSFEFPDAQAAAMED